MNDFYHSLYKNDSYFFAFFNKYFVFQIDSKSKNNSNFIIMNLILFFRKLQMGVIHNIINL